MPTEVEIKALKAAIMSGNWSPEVIQSLDYACLNEPLDTEGRTALMWACEHKQIASVKFLIANGAKVNYKSPKNNMTALDAARNVLAGEAITVILKERARQEYEVEIEITRSMNTVTLAIAKFQELEKHNAKEMGFTMGMGSPQPAVHTQAKEQITLNINIYGILQTHLSALNFKTLDLERLKDLHSTLRGLINAIGTATNREAAKKAIREYFACRETLILNTKLDYCFADSVANKICVAVAKQLWPEAESPYDILLGKAKTNRDPVWRDVILETESLPEKANEFFRYGDNEIHDVEALILNAIGRMKIHRTGGYQLLSDVWLRIDLKNSEILPAGLPGEPLPLPLDALQILGQLTPTLKRLVDYSIAVDRFARRNGKQAKKDPYTYFSNLRSGLLKGDAKHGGKELIAGADANIAIAEFSEWWNGLSKQDRSEIGNLGAPTNVPGYRALTQSQHTTIDDILKIILDDGNVFLRDDPNYCIQLKGAMLEQIINHPPVAERLKRGSDLFAITNSLIFGKQSLKPFSSEQFNKALDGMYRTIKIELQKPQPVEFITPPQFVDSTLEMQSSGSDVQELLKAKLLAMVAQGNLIAVKNILDNHADLLLNERLNSKNQTALIIAASLGHADIVAYLILKGADVHLKDVHHKSARQWAVELRPFQASAESPFSKVIAKIVAVEIMDAIKQNALHHVIPLIEGHPTALNEPVNAAGDTALILAVKEKREGTVEYLLSQLGQDFFHTGSDNLNARQWAQALEKKSSGEDKLLFQRFSKSLYEAEEKIVVKELTAAILSGKLSRVQKIIQSNPDRYLNIRLDKGQTPLILAAKHSNENMVDYLLLRGADPNLSDAYGNQACTSYYAYPKYQWERKKKRIQMKIEGFKLVEFVKANNAAAVEEGIRSNPDFREEVINHRGDTLLTLAATLGKLAVVEKLIALNVDPMKKGSNAYTPLECVVKRIAELPEHEKKTYTEIQRLLIVAEERAAESSLFYAINEPNVDSVKYILGKYPRLKNAALNTRGETAFIAAVSARSEYIVEYLLDEAQVDVFVRDNNGKNAFDWANELDGVSNIKKRLADLHLDLRKRVITFIQENNAKELQNLVANMPQILNENVLLEGTPATPLEVALQFDKVELVLSILNGMSATELSEQLLAKIVDISLVKNYTNILDLLFKKFFRDLSAHKGSSRYYLLEFAIRNKRSESAANLLTRRADPNYVSGVTRTNLLWFAHEQGLDDIVASMFTLEKNKLTAKTLQNALLRACYSPKDTTAFVKQIFESATVALDVNEKDCRLTNGNTMLHEAVGKEKLEVIKLLCSKGANGSIENAKGETPFTLALKAGRFDIAKIIIDSMSGTELDEKKFIEIIKIVLASDSPYEVQIINMLFAKFIKPIPPSKRVFLIDLAIKHNDSTLALALLKRKVEPVDPNYRFSGDTNTLLWEAYEKGWEKVIECILGFKELKPAILRHAIYKAASSPTETTAFIERILKAFPNTDVSPKHSSKYSLNENTSLHAAILQGKKSLCQLLCSRGANVLIQNKEGETPIAMACSLMRFDIAELLIQNLPKEFDRKDLIPIGKIILATKHSSLIEVFRKVVKSHPGSLNHLLALAITVNTHFYSSELCNMLLSLGADPNDVTHSKNLLFYAHKKGLNDVVDILLSSEKLSRRTLCDAILRAANSPQDMTDLVQKILERKPSLDVNSQHSHETGSNALHEAVNQGWGKMVVLLCRRGADARKPNKQGDTPLRLALRSRRFDIAPDLAQIIFENAVTTEFNEPKVVHNSFETFIPQFIAQIDARASARNREVKAALEALQKKHVRSKLTTEAIVSLYDIIMPYYNAMRESRPKEFTKLEALFESVFAISTDIGQISFHIYDKRYLVVNSLSFLAEPNPEKENSLMDIAYKIAHSKGLEIMTLTDKASRDAPRFIEKSAIAKYIAAQALSQKQESLAAQQISGVAASPAPEQRSPAAETPAEKQGGAASPAPEQRSPAAETPAEKQGGAASPAPEPRSLAAEFPAEKQRGAASPAREQSSLVTESSAEQQGVAASPAPEPRNPTAEIPPGSARSLASLSLHAEMQRLSGSQAVSEQQSEQSSPSLGASLDILTG